MIKRISIVLTLLFAFSFGQFVFALNTNSSTGTDSTLGQNDNRRE